MNEEEQRILDEHFAAEDALAQEIETSKERKAARKAARGERLRRQADGIFIQTVGTVLGGGILAAIATLTGIIQRTPATTFVSVLGVAIPAVAGVGAGILSNRGSKNAARTTKRLEANLATMSRLREARERAQSESKGGSE